MFMGIRIKTPWQTEFKFCAFQMLKKPVQMGHVTIQDGYLEKGWSYSDCCETLLL